MAGAGRGGAWGRSCPVPPRRSRSSAAPQPHLPRGQSAQPAVRTRRRRPTRYGGAGGRGEPRGRGELLGEQPEGPGGGRRQPRRASRVFPCGIPGGRSALGGSRAERPPGMGVLRVWGDPGYSSCAGGARVPTVPAVGSSAPALGDTTGPTTAPAPGYRHPWSTPNFGYLHPRVVPLWGGSIPGLFPSPRYPHARVIVIARVTSRRVIPDYGVSPSPGYPKVRLSPDSGTASLGFLFPLFLEYFRPPGTPIPGLFPFLAGYSHPQGTPIPVPWCPAWVPAELPSFKMAGLGAGWQTAKWLGAARHPPRSLPRGLHNVPWPVGSRWQPRAGPGSPGRGCVWFRGVAALVRDSVPVRSQPPPP